ncbi:MAG: rhamnogalacturonan acetylesterase [bacterium]
MKRFLVLLLAATLSVGPEQKPIIYMIGDSTMADRPTPERNPYRGWGQLLSTFMDDSVMVRNFAVNGRSTKSFIDEGKWAAVVARIRAGDFVLIQFGHNDEKKEDSTRYTDPNGTFKVNLARFVRESRARGATPILFTSIERRSFDSNGKLKDTHGAYPQATRDVARELGVPMVDLQKSTGAMIVAAGLEGSKTLFGYVLPKTNEMYPDGLTDDTHLSLKGATEVARLAALGISTTVPTLGRHVTGVTR